MSKGKNKALKIFVWSLIGAGVVTGGIFGIKAIVKSGSPDVDLPPPEKDKTTAGNTSGSTSQNTTATTNTASSTNVAPSGVQESFPLNKGMRGPNVLAMQAALGVKPQTGYFWTITAAALKKKKIAIPVSQADWEKITGQNATTSPVIPTGLKHGDLLWLISDDHLVYTYPSYQSPYKIGSNYVTLNRSQTPVGMFDRYSDSEGIKWVRFTNDSGKTFYYIPAAFVTNKQP